MGCNFCITHTVPYKQGFVSLQEPEHQKLLNWYPKACVAEKLFRACRTARTANSVSFKIGWPPGSLNREGLPPPIILRWMTDAASQALPKWPSAGHKSAARAKPRKVLRDLEHICVPAPKRLCSVGGFLLITVAQRTSIRPRANLAVREIFFMMAHGSAQVAAIAATRNSPKR